MDVSLLRFLIVEATNEEGLLPKIREWRKNLPQFHGFALAFGPPLFGVKAIARKQYGQTDRRLAGRSGGARLISPDGQRFHPGQRHRDAHTSKERSPCEFMGIHS